MGACLRGLAVSSLLTRLGAGDPARGSRRGELSRDLEHLLNTRSEGARCLPDAFPECRRSSLTYGIPDFSAHSLLNVHDRERIRRALEHSITLHEPRLERVRIKLEPVQALDRTLQFRIDAVTVAGREQEKVRFDAVLQLGTQVYRVS